MAPCSKRNEKKKNSNNNPTEYTPRKTRITVAHCYLDYVTNDYLFGTRNLNHIFLFQFPSLIFFFSLAPLFCMYDRVCVRACVCASIFGGHFSATSSKWKMACFFSSQTNKKRCLSFSHLFCLIHVFVRVAVCVCPYTDTDVSIADMGVLVCV